MATLAITTEHDVQGIGYDLNGNIQALARYGADNGTVPSFGMWDRLTYTYSGNQLVNVLDMAGYPLGTEGFYGVIYNPGTQYAYDPNGNMKSDTNKGIGTIIYNHLNLPAEINFDSGNSIGYVYDALGTKLSKTVDGAGQVTTQYAGGFIYSDAGEKGMELRFFSHPEGYVEPLADGEGVRGFGFDVPGPTYSSYRYVYNYTDHQGNVRLSYSDLDLNGAIDPSTEILDEKNYYPFGGEHKGYNSNINGAYHPYGYNGKEEQDELGLEWIDYGARNYDKWLVRYFNVDRMSEAYYDLNPYQYTANNPIKFIDVNGDYIYIWENDTQYRYENGEIQKQNEKGKWIKHSAQEGSYVSQIAGALGSITGGDPNSFGSQFLGLFENDDVNVRLFENTSQGKHKGKNVTDGTDIYTFFNQSGSIRTTGGSEKVSENFHITLGHELAHGLGNNLLSKGALSDTWIPADPNIGLKDPIKNSEVFASMYENMLRSEQGLELRTHYIGGTSDNRSRLILKSKTKSPFGKVYNPTQATLEIFNSLIRRPKAKSVNSIKPAGGQ